MALLHFLNSLKLKEGAGTGAPVDGAGEEEDDGVARGVLVLATRLLAGDEGDETAECIAERVEVFRIAIGDDAVVVFVASG